MSLLWGGQPRTGPDTFLRETPRKTLALVAFVEHCPNRGGQR